MQIIDPYVALSGLVVGLVVGLTGMGGGALMTPILVLFFRIEPLSAISSDLVASMLMKPVASAVHLRRGTANLGIARWLMLGSVPAAFAGVFMARLLGRDGGRGLQTGLGIVLIASATMITARGILGAYRRQKVGPGRADLSATEAPRVRKGPTALVGLIAGWVVGVTSVGSGSVVIVALMGLYPRLKAGQLVGTDLVQAVPLVTAAGIGHLLFGAFHPAITASILLGSLPGAYIGAKLSARSPDWLIRPALVLVLFASGLKLLSVGGADFGPIVLALLLIALPVLGYKAWRGMANRRFHYQASGRTSSVVEAPSALR